MKKHYRYLTALLLLAAMMLSMSACGKKMPVSVGTFQETMQSLGYEEAVIDDDGSDIFEQLDEFTAAARQTDDSTCVARFFVAKSEPAAISIFNGTRENADDLVSLPRSNFEKNMGNYSSYRVKNGERDVLLARIDNTILYIIADKNMSDDVSEIAKTLGYN